MKRNLIHHATGGPQSASMLMGGQFSAYLYGVPTEEQAVSGAQK